MTAIGLDEDAFRRTEAVVKAFENIPGVGAGTTPVDLSQMALFRTVVEIIAEAPDKEGFYEAKEIILDEDGEPIDPEGAIIFDDTTDGVGFIRELTGLTGIAAGEKVHCFGIGLDEGGQDDNLTLWWFVAGAGNGVGGPGTTDSLTSVPFDAGIAANRKGKHHLILDAIIGALGSAVSSEYYGGWDQNGVSRAWKPIYDPDFNKISMITPEDDGDAAQTGQNERLIRATNTNKQQSLNLRHGNYPSSVLGSHIIDGIYGVDAATFAAMAGGHSVVKEDLALYNIGDRHHLYRDGVGYVEDPNDPYVEFDALAFRALDDIAATGTLFNDLLAQEVQTVDAGGANITTYDTLGANPLATTFQYSATTTLGLPIEMGISTANAIKPVLGGEIIEEYNVAPKNGNDDSFNFNFARYGFNTQITVKAELEGNPFASVSKTIPGENDMTMDTVFSAEPADAVAFNVTATLKKAGVLWTRPEGLEEYQMRFEFKYLSDGLPVNVGGAGAGLNIITVNDDDAGWSAGVVTATQTPVIPAIRSNDKIIVCPVMKWYQNPLAQVAMLGDTNYPSVCASEDINGSNDFTHSVAGGSIASQVSAFSSANDGLGLLDNPISFEYEILDNALATTLMSVGGVTSKVEFFAVGNTTALGVTVDFLQGAGDETDDEFFTDIINPTNSNVTDGLLFVLKSFTDQYDLVPGADYKVKVTTPGIGFKEFTFELLDTLMCWWDSFGSDPQDQATTVPYAGRWTETNSAGCTNTINGSFELVQTVIAGAAVLRECRLESRFAEVSGMGFDTKLIEAHIPELLMSNNTDRQYLYLSNSALDDLIIGFEVVSSILVFQIDAPGFLLEKDLGLSSAVLQVERGDFNYGDNFGGLGQNSVSEPGGVFNSRYSTISDGTGTITIASSELVLTSPSAGSSNTNNQTVKISDSFDGDFTVEYDYTSNYASEYIYYFGLETSGASIRYIAHNIRVGFTGIYYYTGAAETVATDQTQYKVNGTAKFVRSGTSLSGYFNDVLVNTWTIGASEAFNDLVFTAVQQHATTGTGTLNISEIRFTNDDTGQEYTVKRLLFGVSDALKYAYDDSASPLTKLELVSSTEDVSVLTTKWTKIKPVDNPTGTPFCTDPP